MVEKMGTDKLWRSVWKKSRNLEYGTNIIQKPCNGTLAIWDHWNFETLKPTNQETSKPRNFETKKPRNQEPKKPRIQETPYPSTYRLPPLHPTTLWFHPVFLADAVLSNTAGLNVTCRLELWQPVPDVPHANCDLRAVTNHRLQLETNTHHAAYNMLASDVQYWEPLWKHASPHPPKSPRPGATYHGQVRHTSTSGRRPPPVGSRPPRAGSRLLPVGSKRLWLRSTACGVQTSACGLQTTDCGLQDTACGLQTHRLWANPLWTRIYVWSFWKYGLMSCR